MQLPEKGQELSVSEVIAACVNFGYDELAEHIKKNPPDYPFRSDGMSAMPETIFGIDLYPAAFWHDVKYWSGIKYDANARSVADYEFAIDAIKLGCSHYMAEMLRNGVRIGGTELLPTTWKWGFGRKS